VGQRTTVGKRGGGHRQDHDETVLKRQRRALSVPKTPGKTRRLILEAVLPTPQKSRTRKLRAMAMAPIVWPVDRDNGEDSDGSGTIQGDSDGSSTIQGDLDASASSLRSLSQFQEVDDKNDLDWTSTRSDNESIETWIYPSSDDSDLFDSDVDDDEEDAEYAGVSSPLHNIDGKFNCYVKNCLQQFDTWISVITHVKRRHRSTGEDCQDKMSGDCPRGCGCRFQSAQIAFMHAFYPPWTRKCRGKTLFMEDRSYQCPIVDCDELFVGWYDKFMREHIQSHHSSHEEAILCKWCNQLVASSDVHERLLRSI
jgi:hypothetical protein